MANLVPLGITVVVLIAILAIASGISWWMTRRTPERIKRDVEKNCQIRNKVMYCTDTIPCDSLAMLLKTHSVCMNVEHSERNLHVIDHQQG
ncbi:MAG TPA: hypothetical protein VLI92_04155, partial [Candidatus Saccharimonadales bacterium]|nr:hypothetical protein [Candidatus Saccharimonadales bacterium]